MKGRKPKPTRIKIMEGNPGQRPLNAAEPLPRQGEPPCPEWLDDEAKEKWAEIAPELARIGVLTLVDGDVLAVYCQAWAEYRQATRRLQKEGRCFRSEKTGHMMPHPANAQQGRAREAIRQFAALLGLDPSSRVRLKVETPQPMDPMEAFLNEQQRKPG